MAKRLPPEVLDHIIKCFISPFLGAFDTPPNAEDKRALGRWSLTCRHWARTCRPWLFQILSIRSKEDIHVLFDIARSTADGSKPIGHYVDRLTLCWQQSPSESPPWIHLIHLSDTKSLLPSLFLIDVDIGSTSSGDEPLEFRSIQSGLPRSYPGRWPIRTGAEIHNLYFHTFHDLIPALDSVNVGYITLDGVSWKDEADITFSHIPASAFSMRPRIQTSHVLSIVMTACTASWPSLWYILTVRPPHARRSPSRRLQPVFVHHTEMPTLLALARVLWDDCKCIRCHNESRTKIRHRTHVYRNSLDRMQLSTEYLDPTGDAATIHYAEVFVTLQGLVWKLEFHPWWGQDTSVETFAPDETQFAWEALDEHVANLASMDEFVIAVRDNEKRTVEAYIRPRMQRLETAGKLRFRHPWKN